jgi:hypothetical protein
MIEEPRTIDPTPWESLGTSLLVQMISKDCLLVRLKEERQRIWDGRWQQIRHVALLLARQLRTRRAICALRVTKIEVTVPIWVGAGKTRALLDNILLNAMASVVPVVVLTSLSPVHKVRDVPQQALFRRVTSFICTITVFNL